MGKCSRNELAFKQASRTHVILPSQHHELLTNLQWCSREGDLCWGRIIHSKAIESENDSNKYILNALINMYRKSESMLEAHCLFDKLQHPNVVHWTTLVLGYAENGEAGVSLDLFAKMKATGLAPTSVTYIAVFKACISLAESGNTNGKEDSLEQGRKIHLEIDCNMESYVLGTLVDMYSKCGNMILAREVFDSIQNPDTVQCNTLMLGYAENGEAHVALDLFTRMKAAGFVLTSGTYIAAFKSCASLAVNGDANAKLDSLARGRNIHSEISCELSHPLQTTLIDMYSKCGSTVEAHEIFDSIQKPNVVSWTALLLGYAEEGKGHTVLQLFARMKASGCVPNSVTYLAALKASGFIGALALGRKFHLEISDFTTNIVTCLVDFYAKCGSMVDAREVFDFHSASRDKATWNALLAGYGRFGESDSVFNLFESMKNEKLRPDEATFLGLLLCCSHAGLVDKAQEYFAEMSVQYQVNPTLVHYTCMVSLLGRGNKLNDAIWIIRRMPCRPDVVIWRTLLGACRKWKNTEIGREAFNALADMKNDNGSPYVLMAHIYRD